MLEIPVVCLFVSLGIGADPHNELLPAQHLAVIVFHGEDHLGWSLADAPNIRAET